MHGCWHNPGGDDDGQNNTRTEMWNSTDRQKGGGWMDTGVELQEKPLRPLMPHQPYGLLKLMQDIFIDPTKYLKNILMKQ